jgi:hypothetical protein
MGDGASLPSLPSLPLPTMLPPGSYTRLISTMLILGQYVMLQAKPQRAQEGKVRARRRAERCWGEGKCCCGRRRLGRRVPCACLGFNFRMTLGGSGDGAARGEGGAMRGASSAGSMVACAGRAAAATADDWESSEAGRDVVEAVDES